MAVLMKIVSESVDVSGLRARSSCVAVVARATAREVADRFQSPVEMRVAIPSDARGGRVLLTRL